jgi:hypothetical protein
MRRNAWRRHRNSHPGKCNALAATKFISEQRAWKQALPDIWSGLSSFAFVLSITKTTFSGREVKERQRQWKPHKIPFVFTPSSRSHSNLTTLLPHRSASCYRSVWPRTHESFNDVSAADKRGVHWRTALFLINSHSLNFTSKPMD